jgi:hypothetical protein
MPNEDDIARLRRMTGESGSKTYTDTQIEQFLIDSTGNFNVAASRIWGEKASAVADMVNISEAGSSRSNSDLYDHAIDRQNYFASLGTGADVPTVASSTTRRIERV